MSETASERLANHLVEPDWLQARLDDPAIRIVDMRGYVVTETRPDGFQTADYRGARDEYLQSHIPGAVYLDWTTDIVDTEDPVPAQVAPAEKIAQVLGRAGIGDDTLVVAYDNHPASQFATRLWWVLRYYGHPNVRILNGGWNRWVQEGRPVTDEVPAPGKAVFTPSVDASWRQTWKEVAEKLGTESQIVDARDEAQFTGKVRRGPRGGHIPGAFNVPREDLIAPDGRWRPVSELREAIELRGMRPDKEVIAYCNGGVAATSVLFALSILGFPHLSNYDGSWNEWGLRPDLPIESSS